jgi:hypothetical protein
MTEKAEITLSARPPKKRRRPLESSVDTQSSGPSSQFRGGAPTWRARSSESSYSSCRPSQLNLGAAKRIQQLSDALQPVLLRHAPPKSIIRRVLWIRRTSVRRKSRTPTTRFHQGFTRTSGRPQTQKPSNSPDWKNGAASLSRLAHGVPRPRGPFPRRHSWVLRF